jgi:hypothetical protein
MTHQSRELLVDAARALTVRLLLTVDFFVAAYIVVATQPIWRY